MSCGSEGGRFTRKKIIVLSLVGSGIAAGSYFALTSTNIQTVAASSALLGVMACPAMCAVMGGGIWIVNKISKKKDKNKNRQDVKNQRLKSKSHTLKDSCCSNDVNENHKREHLENTEIPALTRLKKKLKRNSEDSAYNWYFKRLNPYNKLAYPL